MPLDFKMGRHYECYEIYDSHFYIFKSFSFKSSFLSHLPKLHIDVSIDNLEINSRLDF